MVYLKHILLFAIKYCIETLDIFVLVISQNLRPEYCCFFSLELCTSTSNGSQHLRQSHSDYTNRSNQSISDQPSPRLTDIYIPALFQSPISNHPPTRNNAAAHSTSITSVRAKPISALSVGVTCIRSRYVLHFLFAFALVMTPCAFGSERRHREQPSPNHCELWLEM